MNVTISGNIGSGKSTVAKMLAMQLNYKVFDAGDEFRKIAESKGYDVLGLNQAHITEVDKELDEKIKQMGESYSDIIFVSRTAWHFVPNAFKTYLAVDENVGASRVYNRAWNSEKYNDVIDAFYYNRERIAVEDARYKELYNITREQQIKESNLVFYVGSLDLETIVRFIKQYPWSTDMNRLACPTMALIPTQVIKDFNPMLLTLPMLEQAMEFVIADDIFLNYSRGIPMILDGHHRVASMCRNNVTIVATKNWEMKDYLNYVLDAKDYYDWSALTGGEVYSIIQKKEQQKIDDYCVNNCASFTDACATGSRIAHLAKTSGCSVEQVLEDLKMTSSPDASNSSDDELFDCSDEPCYAGWLRAAKHLLVDLIYSQARAAGICVVFTEVNDIIYNKPCSAVPESINKVSCLYHSWGYLFSSIDKPCTVADLKEMHGLLAAYDVPFTQLGKIQESRNFVPTLDRIDNILRNATTLNTIITAGLTMMYEQLFSVGNERLVFLVINKLLIQHDLGLFIVREADICEYKKLLTKYCRTGDLNVIYDWIKERCIIHDKN